MGYRRLSWVLVGVSFVGAIVACAAPPTNKTPLLVCTAGEEGCPDEQAVNARERPASKTEVDRTEDELVAPVATSRDSGRDAAASLDPTCAALKPCCAALLAAKITGSAGQCDRVVADDNGYSCQLARNEYRTPDDFYDPPTACK